MDKIYCELCENFVNDDEMDKIYCNAGDHYVYEEELTNVYDAYNICKECMNKIEEERKKIPVKN